MIVEEKDAEVCDPAAEDFRERLRENGSQAVDIRTGMLLKSIMKGIVRDVASVFSSEESKPISSDKG